MIPVASLLFMSLAVPELGPGPVLWLIPLFSWQTVCSGGAGGCEGVSHGGQWADCGKPHLPPPPSPPFQQPGAPPHLGSALVGFHFSVPVHLSCGLSSQVFDATNTTRERRALILNFAEENSFKVESASKLEEEG